MKTELKYISLGGEHRTGVWWSDASKPGCKWLIDAGPPRRFVLVRVTEGARPMIKEVKQ